MNNTQTNESIKNGSAAFWLGIVSTIGFILILLFGFGLQLVRVIFGDWITYSTSWGLGALIWTITFVLYYYFLVIPETKIKWVNKLVPILVWVVIGILAYNSYFALKDPGAFRWYVICTIGIGAFLLVVDLLLFFNYTEDTNKRNDFLYSILLADIPSLFSLIVLAIFYFVYPTVENIEKFLSGAIAFQFLGSNLIFILIQGHVYQFLREKMKT